MQVQHDEPRRQLQILRNRPVDPIRRQVQVVEVLREGEGGWDGPGQAVAREVESLQRGREGPGGGRDGASQAPCGQASAAGASSRQERE